jgi:hypothetical protein
LITTGTQTIAGAKTFTGAITANGTVTINNPTNSAAVVRINAHASGSNPTQYSTWNENSAFICYLDNAADNPGFGVLSVGGSYTKVAIGLNSGDPYIGFGSGNAGRDIFLTRDSAATLAQRNSTNAQTFRVYNTYTSSTSFENLQFKAVAGAAYQIGSAKGSAGGSNRDIDIGSYDSAGTYTTAFRVKTTAGLEVGGSGGNGNFINVRGPAADWGDYGIGYWNASDATVLYGYAGRNVSIGHMVYGRGTYYPRLAFDGYGSAVFTPGVATSGSPTAFTITGAAHTTLALSTEATDVNFNLSRTVQFATGALTTQRAMRIQAPTYSFVGASTITTASTLSISGPPVAGTNATITNAYALSLENGGLNINNSTVNKPAATINALDCTSNYAVTINALTSAVSGYPYQNILDIYAQWTGDNAVQSASSLFRVRYGSYTPLSLVGHGTLTLAGYVPSLVIGGMTLNSSSITFTDATIVRESAGVISHRFGTSAQTLRVYNTYTSSTSFETLQFKAVASNSFEIATAVGSAGGTTRGLRFGTYATATPSTLTYWAEFVGSTGSWITYGGSNLVYRFGDIATGSVCNFRKARGTLSAPTAVASSDTVSAIQTSGYGTTGYSGIAAQIAVTATETWTDSANGTRMTFATTATGGTSLTTRLTVENDGTVGFTKAVGWGTETVNTPSGTTQTITLDSANHQTLTLVSATGTVTATLTVPTRGSSSGTIIVKQHASAAKDITWAVSAGTITWMGTEPDWAADAINSVRIVSWRYDGSVMYLASTEVAV